MFEFFWGKVCPHLLKYPVDEEFLILVQEEEERVTPNPTCNYLLVLLVDIFPGALVVIQYRPAKKLVTKARVIFLSLGETLAFFCAAAANVM